MQALSFGGHAAWLHDAPGDTLAVMCGAQGYEELCTQRGWYELAEMISARGFPALRFDYAGCGDSAGDDFEPARVEAWRASVRQAIACARETLGARRIVLIGLRLGALLAAEAAIEDAAIAGVVLLGAPASGRAWAREMQVTASIVGVPPEGVAPWPAPADGFQVGGFHFTRETSAALARLPKPGEVTGAFGARPLLVLTIEAGTPASAGAQVTSRPFDDFQPFMVDRIFSRPPATAWAAVTAWLTRHWPPTPAAALARRAPPPAEIGDGRYAETPARFGPDGLLYGVLCRPAAAPPDTVFILVNTAANHHIGWGRATVHLARALAGRGVASLRIDLSGLGCSAALPGRAAQQVYSQEAVSDVTAALDWLVAQGFTRFGVAGTCSGAYLAFHAAVADERLSCAVAVNLNRFVWPHDLSVENSVRHVYQPSAVYARKAADPRTLLRVLKGEVDAIGIARALGGRLATRLRARAAGLLNRAVGERGARSAGTPRGWLHRLAERRARLLFVFTSQDAGLDEIDKHFGSLARLAALPGVKAAMVDNADHNFSPQWARDQLIALLTDFAAAAPCGGFDAPGPQP